MPVPVPGRLERGDGAERLPVPKLALTRNSCAAWAISSPLALQAVISNPSGTALRNRSQAVLPRDSLQKQKSSGSQDTPTRVSLARLEA